MGQLAILCVTKPFGLRLDERIVKNFARYKRACDVKLSHIFVQIKKKSETAIILHFRVLMIYLMLAKITKIKKAFVK